MSWQRDVDGGLGATRHEDPESEAPSPGETSIEAWPPPAPDRSRSGLGATRGEDEATTLDGSHAPSLPAELRGRFRVVRELLAKGSEADVFEAVERASGEPRALKLYHRTRRLRHGTFDTIRELSGDGDGRRHLVRLYECGEVRGRHYEVQEFCRPGSLADLLGPPSSEARRLPFSLYELVDQVAAALAFLQHHMFHRDLKPANLLVRSTGDGAGLDVVLSDFGLARDAAAGSLQLTLGGTLGYQPPEAADGELTAAWDWWSLGIVVAEVTLGHHPLARWHDDGAGGGVWREPSAAEVVNAIGRHPIDVSGIADERVRNLCRGLLVRDRRDRWGHDEVAAWLAGHDPEVPDDTVPSAAAPAGPPLSVQFVGAEYREVGDLAQAFTEHWAQAIQALFQAREQGWLRPLLAFLEEQGRSRAASIVRGGVDRPGDIPSAFVELLVELDPDRLPTFDGLSLTPAGLEAEARAVLDGGRTGDRLRDVRRSGVLALWRRLPGVPTDSAEIDATWRSGCQAIEDRARAVRVTAPALQAESVDQAMARLLLCTLDARHAEQMARDLAEARRSASAQVPWWAALAEDGARSHPAAALATVTAAGAANLGELSQVDRRQVRADARERQREARNKARGAGRTGPLPVPMAQPRSVLVAGQVGRRLRTTLAVGLLTFHVWLILRCEDEVRAVAAAGSSVTASALDTTAAMDALSAAVPAFVAVAVAVVVVHLARARVIGPMARPLRVRGYMALTGGVELVAILAIVASGLIEPLVADAAASATNLGFPPGFLPPWAEYLGVAYAVLLAGSLIALVRAVMRTLRAVNPRPVVWRG